jgi:hypothetical protein
MEKKETAVDYLIKNIEIALKLNGVKLNHMYRMNTVYPHYSKAKAMEEQQHADTWNNAINAVEKDKWQSFEQYYTETYDAQV